MKAPNAACTNCGTEMWTTRSDRVRPCCRPCRQRLTREEKLALGVIRAEVVGVCLECGGPAVSTTGYRRIKFCSPKCYGAFDGRRRLARRGVAVVNKTIRRDRDRVAPGLGEKARRRLLAEWRNQRRPCFYCGADAADTVDHVVPLALGGTNYEGNLVPACRSCNSSKQDHLLFEWRLRCQRTTALRAA